MIDAALEAGAEMIGLVFFAKSPRSVSLVEAARLADHMRGKTQIVALCVDMPLADMEQMVAQVQPDILQLHGTESTETCAQVRERFSRPVMKALGVSCAADIEAAFAYGDVIDRFLFDAKPPKNSDIPGGNGIRFDWTLLRDTKLPKPYMLSGGLDASNVAEALRVSGAPAVDVSSGVESSRGVKDPAKISAFLRAVRGAHMQD